MPTPQFPSHYTNITSHLSQCKHHTSLQILPAQHLISHFAITRTSHHWVPPPHFVSPHPDNTTFSFTANIHTANTTSHFMHCQTTLLLSRHHTHTHTLPTRLISPLTANCPHPTQYKHTSYYHAPHCVNILSTSNNIFTLLVGGCMHVTVTNWTIILCPGYKQCINILFARVILSKYSCLRISFCRILWYVS